MSQKSRQEVLEQARERYARRGRQARNLLLDEVCVLCGYGRRHAIKVLGGRRAIASVSSRRRGGSVPAYGEPERAVRLRYHEKRCGNAAARNAAVQSDLRAHRAWGCRGARFYRDRHGGSLRGIDGRGVLLELAWPPRFHTARTSVPPL